MTSTETEKGKPVGIHGLMAEFSGPESLLEAARRSFAEGYRRMDAYSPFPVDGLAEALILKSHALSERAEHFDV